MTRAGTQTLLMGVYRNLDRTKVQVDFVVHTEQPSDFDDEIARLGGRIFRVPSPRAVGPVRFATGVDAILRRPDGFAGIHAHLYLFSGYLLWLAWKFANATASRPLTVERISTIPKPLSRARG